MKPKKKNAAAHSARQRAHNRRSMRKIMGYECRPPTCGSCVMYIEGFTKGRLHYRAKCSMGEFDTSHYSICDKWTSKSGDIIK